MATLHPDDEFHTPANDDPHWTETCWFTFTVPERRLSGQFYPFFRPNQRVCAAAVYFWDDKGDQPWNALYAKNFWHLPIPDQPLSNIQLPNGIAYRCLEPMQRYELRYDDPDGGNAVNARLTFTGVAQPHYLMGSHLDQPGRYEGTIVLHGEEIAVNSFGFRDRSWGVRPEFGLGLGGSPATNGGYTYATASERDAFHILTMNFGEGCISIHGYLLRNGEWSALASGRREVVERDPATGFPVRVRVEGVDELGRSLQAAGRCVNRFAFLFNPNGFTINCLTEWTFDGITAWGEDHDNWSVTAGRKFFRHFLGYDKARR